MQTKNPWENRRKPACDNDGQVGPVRKERIYYDSDTVIELRLASWHEYIVCGMYILANGTEHEIVPSPVNGYFINEQEAKLYTTAFIRLNLQRYGLNESLFNMLSKKELDFRIIRLF